MRILVYGSCNLDRVFSVRRIVVPGETAAVLSVSEKLGGKGLNQAIAAARAGADVSFAGKIGPDGEALRDALRLAGADTRDLKCSSVPTGQAVIQVEESGQNCILLYPGANAENTENEIDGVLDRFCSGDLLILQNEIPNLSALISLAATRGIRVMFNPSPMDETAKAADLSKVSWLLLNETEAEAFYPNHTPEEAIHRLHADFPNLTVVLTLGSKGCLYTDGDAVRSQAAFCVDPVDTTGAGDTFTGYFAAGIAAKSDLSSAVIRATAAAALATTRQGAAESIPTVREVDAFLHENRNFS